MEFHELTDPAELAGKLAARVAALLSDAVKDKGRATLVVSGGSTPVPFFISLAAKNIDWARVIITLADERWLPPSDPDSNEGLVKRHLLVKRAAAAHFIKLYTGAGSAVEAEQECDARIAAMGLPFDVLVLGMGNDGHTASLFPGAANLAAAVNMESGKLCMAITPPAASHERMTLTLPALVQAKNIFLHLTGPEKKQILDKALESGPCEDMPVRYIFSRMKQPIKVYWSP